MTDCRIDVACDVTNPLTDPQGASAVFGPQRATAAMIERLDRGLQHFAQIIDRDLDIDVLSLKGGGGRVWGSVKVVLRRQLRPNRDRDRCAGVA